MGESDNKQKPEIREQVLVPGATKRDLHGTLSWTIPEGLSNVFSGCWRFSVHTALPGPSIYPHLLSRSSPADHIAHALLAGRGRGVGGRTLTKVGGGSKGRRPEAE